MAQPPAAPPTIGLFDSGIGGITVQTELRRWFPEARFVYVADTAWLPYGTKTDAQIAARVVTLLGWLLTRYPLDALVVACNSSAGVFSEVVDILNAESVLPQGLPWIDPIGPVCRWLTQQDTLKNVGLLATPATVRAGRYAQALGHPISLVSFPIPELAALVERGEMDTPACYDALRRAMPAQQTAHLDALILGCTHYPWASRAIAACLPETVRLLDPAGWMGRGLYQAMASLDALKEGGWAAARAKGVADAPPVPTAPQGQLLFYVTGDAETFGARIARLGVHGQVRPLRLASASLPQA
jgi:glutamate racemase